MMQIGVTFRCSNLKHDHSSQSSTDWVICSLRGYHHFRCRRSPRLGPSFSLFISSANLEVGKEEKEEKTMINKLNINKKLSK